MNTLELHAILPLLVLSAGIVLLLLQVSFWRSNLGALCTTQAIFIAAVAACFNVGGLLRAGPGSIEVTGLLKVDHPALFVSLLLLLAAIAVAFLGYHYLQRRCDPTAAAGSYPEEFYILVLLTMLGAVSLAHASHFASFFLALELIGLSLYPLLGFAAIGDISPQRDQLYSLESGIKYLVLSALSTAIGLFGIALIYTACGALEFSAVTAVLPKTSGGTSLLVVGLTLLLISVAFKLSLVPFHIWTPDVYQGAPTPVTALIATVGKGAVVAVLLRLFAQLDLFSHTAFTGMLAVVAVASMLGGNLLALLQGNIKRLLAYSSIAHLGYLIVAFLIGGSAFGAEAVLYYLVAYMLTTLGAFAVVSLIADAALPSTPGGRQPIADSGSDPFHLDYYRGLFWRSPWLACCLSAMLLSLAGIPLTIGFIGKFYIFAAGVQGQLWLLLGTVVVGSALGLFYYLRLLLAMVQRDQDTTPAAAGRVQIAASGHAVLAVLTFALLLFGVFPQILINWINAL